ncbi:hypothetical protein KSP40_PGU010103 [Platanthera guangdongensis]|uniref:Uncharacterized protein n=1 Tax=Platanthera guangdongensis TaxID=2320717 RepID=A0ABR2M5Q2_9ASPA
MKAATCCVAERRGWKLSSSARYVMVIGTFGRQREPIVSRLLNNEDFRGIIPYTVRAVYFMMFLSFSSMVVELQ